MMFSAEDLAEAKRQIVSTIHKLEETVKTLEAKENAARLRPQITLAKRRIRAFGIAAALIEREISSITDDEIE